MADKTIKCEQCDREFTQEEAIEYPGKVHVHKHRIVCEDCLVDMGVSPDQANSYADYIRTHTEPGIMGPL